MKQRIMGAPSLALIGWALALAPAAHAKKPVLAGPTIEMSDSFRAGAEAAQVALRAGDAATAGARIGALMPMSDFEAYAAAALRFQLATLRGNVQGQRIALTDMFKTSAVPAADAPRLRYLAAYYSYLVGNYDDATAQLGYARTLGYDAIDATMLTADIFMRKSQPKLARPLVEEAIARRKASGEAISPAWYDRAISLAYLTGDWKRVGELYRERLSLYASREDWRSALSNYLVSPGIDAQGQLDLYRLQAATGAMASERDYQAYAVLAEKAGYNAEAKAIIEAGRTAGKLTATQPVTSKLLASVAPKAKKDIAGLPALAAKAAKANSGGPAEMLGDTYVSLAQFPQAVEQYRLAASKGGVDADRLNSRLGMALARSGDLAGAKAALVQVGGNWSSVAGFWSAWVDAQSRKASAEAGGSRVAA